MKRVFNDIRDFTEIDGLHNEKEKDKKKFQNKIGATLFLLDARKKMFSFFDGSNSAFISCLRSIRKFIRCKIFNEEKHYCGVILLGTKENKNLLNLNNITVILELSLIGVQHILKIDEIIKAVENSSYIKEHGLDSFSLGDALWLSTHIFNKRSQNILKSIVFFTNDDNPVTTEKNDCVRAITSAQDMSKNHIDLNLIQLGKNFDSSKFYKKLFQASCSDINSEIPDPVTNFKELECQTNKTNFKHISLLNIPFVIGENFEIGVSVCFLVKKRKAPFKVKLSKATNERVTSKMLLFETETGSLVDEDNVIKSQVVGLKDINFKLEELKFISGQGKAELKLMGFKPVSTISLENFIKPCAFIYPNEYTHKGSTVFFTAFLKRCIAKQVVPICTFSPRTTSTHRFVALIAQDQNTDNSNSSIGLSQGFVAVFLPFAEEIRPFDDNPTNRADPEQVKVAIRLIKKLKFKYKVECFQNPRLRMHWAAVEALALDLKEPEEVKDTTIPNYELITYRTGEIAKEFIEAVYPEDYNPEVFGAPKKSRPAGPKTEPRMSLKVVEELIKEGKGVTLTNDILKFYLKTVSDIKGLSKMKKADMLDKVREHLNLN